LKKILFIFVLCLLLFSFGVNAETLSGTITNDGGITSQTFWVGERNTIGGAGGTARTIAIKNIELTGGTTALIHFDKPDTHISFSSADDGISGKTTNFTWKTNGGAHILATGTMGYQRFWDNAFPIPNEIAGYQYWVFDTWNITGLSGTVTLSHDLYNTSYINYYYQYAATNATFYPDSNGKIVLSNTLGYLTGDFINNRNNPFINEYIAEKPSGLGITGNVTKLVGGNYYLSRAYITNAITGQGIASQSLVTSETFEFNTNAESIIISTRDSLGTWHNSSTLFGATPTPTPTPTPTTTINPNPTGDSNITIYVKNSINNTPISTSYVQIDYQTNNNQGIPVQQQHAGYTDANGMIVMNQPNVNNQLISAYKSGYNSNSKLINLAGDTTETIYLSPSGSGGVPTSVSITMVVRNAVGNSIVSNAYVTISDIILGTDAQSGYTNASGMITFNGITPSVYLGGQIVKTGFITKNWDYQYLPDEDLVLTAYISPIGGTVQPTPTPTPIPYDTLTLVASPDSINLGDSVTLTGGSTNSSRVTYAGGLRRTVFYVNTHSQAYPFDYTPIGIFENVNSTYWKFKDNFDDSFDTATTASPLTMIHTPTTNGIYQYSFAAYNQYNQSISQSAVDVVNVGGGGSSGSLTMNLQAQDGQTNSHLTNYQMNITDDVTGHVTELGTVAYDYEMNLPRGNQYTLRAYKENYEYGAKQFIVPIASTCNAGDFCAIAVVQLYPTGSLSTGNTSVTVRVYDIETYYPLSGVQVNAGTYGIKYTGSNAESVSFTIPQNTAYTVIASKDGYTSSTESKNTGTNDYQQVTMWLRFGTSTPTPTPTPTPSVTVTPLIGYNNGTVAVCGNLPVNATIVDVMLNGLACNGMKDKNSQNMALGMIIVLFCAMILGRIAKGIGVLAGIIVGVIFAVVMGFLPFWIIIVAVILAGLIFAGKVFWQSGG
jgi:hypothetical protein